MRIKATIVAYAFSVQCFENATIVAYAGLRVNHLVFISAHSKEVLSCNRNFLSNTNCISHSAFT